jgi:hypothetical protein
MLNNKKETNFMKSTNYNKRKEEEEVKSKLKKKVNKNDHIVIFRCIGGIVDCHRNCSRCFFSNDQ